MLSYRHAFHAGNHADVLKHTVLLMLARAMQRKEAPVCFMDSHAGAGRYDLDSAQALKNRESATGIGRLAETADAPPEVADYLAAVAACDGTGAARHYPGSPWLLHHAMRERDRLILCEMHGSEIPLLRALFRGERRVQVHGRDGFEGLKAFLPPPERRSLALLDPPYERQQEYRQVGEALAGALKRWPSGVYAIWYPVLERRATERFVAELGQCGAGPKLRVELNVRGDRSGRGMRGSGLVIVNPPWQLEERLGAVVAWLWQRLTEEGDGSWRVAPPE